ncbi:unknown [Roseburia sp. CAG:309]|nr:unknown [Roseburia sp. CAG:309]
MCRIRIKDPAIPAGVTSVTTQYTTAAGTITTAEYINPIRYTPSSLAVSILRTGIGIDNSRSLSLERYNPEKVLNTLPNAPSAAAIIPIMRKYSQLICICANGLHSCTARKVNMPPTTPTMITTYIRIKSIVDILERFLFFFAS